MPQIGLLQARAVETTEKERFKAWENGVDLSSASLNWSGLLLERRTIAPIEWPEFTFDSYSLSFSMNTSPVSTRVKEAGYWKDFDILPGDVFLYSAGRPLQTGWDQPLCQLTLAFDAARMQKQGQEFYSQPLELVPQYHVTDECLRHLTLALMTEVESNGQNGTLFVDAVTTAIVTRLSANYSAFPVDAKPVRGGLSKADLKRVTDYLNDHLTKDVSLDRLSNLVAISPYHFCRLFKQSTGMSPHRFVIEQRVERAKTMLLRGECSIAEVSALVGFYDQSHLTRHCKRMLGVTPRQLREM